MPAYEVVTVLGTALQGSGTYAPNTIFTAPQLASVTSADYMFFMGFDNTGGIGSLVGTGAVTLILHSDAGVGTGVAYVKCSAWNSAGAYGWSSAAGQTLYVLLRGLDQANPIQGTPASTYFYSGAINAAGVTLATPGSLLLSQHVGTGNRDASLTSTIPALTYTSLGASTNIGSWLTAQQPAGDTGTIRMLPDGTGGSSGDSHATVIGLQAAPLPAYQTLIMASSPTYYWPCQELPDGPVTTLTDYGSGVADLTAGGTAPVMSSAGPFGHRCFSATGLAAAKSPSPDANVNTTGYTLECWFATTVVETDAAMIGNWDTDGAMIYVTSGGLVMYHNGSNPSMHYAPPADGSWHHYAITWDGATQRGYVDGVQTAVVATTGGLGSSQRLSLGYYNFSSGTTWANGKIAHAAWYVNQALTPETIQAHFDALFDVDDSPTLFSYTGAQQTYVVPAGVTTLTIEAGGAAGQESSSAGGLGAQVSGAVAVTPGETIYVYVGGAGALAVGDNTGGGFNGGGHSSSDWYTGGGGGGASDVRRGGTALANRVIVAGGGGGGAGGSPPHFPGGAGGATNGEDGVGGTPHNGKGATTSAGGLKGSAGVLSSTGHTDGALGVGGNSKTSGESPCSGGGGGGLYGGGGSGGGSAQHSNGTGGGGGSSLVPIGGTSTTGVQSGNGSVTITPSRAGSVALLQTEIMADSPTGYWPLGDTSGTVATDISGNANHGTYAGTYTLDTNGILFRSAWFTLGKVTVPDPGTLFAGHDLSIEAWIKTYDTFTQTIVMKHHSAAANAKWNLRNNLTTGRGHFYLDSSSGGPNNMLTAGSINDGAWHQVVGTLNASTRALAYYLDGTLVTTGTLPAGGYALSGSTSVLTIGQYDGGTETFDGQIAHVAFFPSVLSGARVAAHWTARVAAEPPGNPLWIELGSNSAMVMG